MVATPIDTQDVVTTIERLFAAVAIDDRVASRALVADEFHAFENGVAMTGPALLDLMSRAHAEGKRYRWSVTDTQVELHGDFAAVTYVNRGTIADAPGAAPMPMTWLETVFLKRQPAGWRMTFLHSTRIKST